MCVLIIKLFASRHQIHLSVFCSVQLGLGPCQSHVSLRVGSLLGFASGGATDVNCKAGEEKDFLFSSFLSFLLASQQQYFFTLPGTVDSAAIGSNLQIFTLPEPDSSLSDTPPLSCGTLLETESQLPVFQTYKPDCPIKRKCKSYKSFKFSGSHIIKVTEIDEINVI